jgi:hypothetical protein
MVNQYRMSGSAGVEAFQKQDAASRVDDQHAAGLAGYWLGLGAIVSASSLVVPPVAPELAALRDDRFPAPHPGAHRS